MVDKWEANMNDTNKCIWIVTYWNSEIEPVVTAFDNKEAAQTCCDYFSKEYSCCLDECNVYSSFTYKIDESEK